MDAEALRSLLDDVASGRVDPATAARRLERLPFADLGYARIDHHRALRQGLPEAVYAPGKTPAECAAIGPEIAAQLYGLTVMARDIADHDGNQTRFVIVARDGVPPPTGHDKTTIVVFQRANEPGSLISILQEFAARRINLSRLESRPTKAGGLGDYCFVIDADGHISDELVAAALRELHAKQGGVKFLGSYPAAGAQAASAREHADTRWRQADDWMADLRRRIR